MLRIWIAFTLLFTLSFSQAQIGVLPYFQQFNSPDWDEPSEASFQKKALENGYGIGLSWWFRLKNTRIEFTPELQYNQAEQDLDQTWQYRSVVLAPLTNFYLLDLSGDCDCPTFSKSSPFFQKGFFVQIGPQAAWSQLSPEEGSSTDQWAFGWIAGAGLDIGLSDTWTLTPLARYSQLLDLDWENFPGTEPPTSRSSSLNSWQFGMKLGIRLGQR